MSDHRPYFPESALAHRYIDPLQPGPGIEIGSAWHNDFGIPNTLNADYQSPGCRYDADPSVWAWYVREHGGESKPVDVVGDATAIPLPDASCSWVIHSHVFEHLPNPLAAIHEWYRLLRPGGILFSTVCRRDTLWMDAEQPVTPIAHLIGDYLTGETWATHPPLPHHWPYSHAHVYTLASYLGLLAHFDPDELKLELLHVLQHDDKVGNGFTTVHRVTKPL